ncbi:MAG: flippase [Eubacteriales bacterium]
MRFVRDTLVTFSTQMAIVVLGIVSTVLIARTLGPGGKGAYTILTLVPAMLALLGNLGIDIANIYLGGSKKYSWDVLVSNSFVVALFLGLPLACAFLAYYFIARPSFLINISPLCVIPATLTVPLLLFGRYFQCILMGQNRITKYNLVTLLQSATFVVLALLALLIFRQGILGVILGWMTAAMTSAIFSLLLVHKTTPVKWDFHPAAFQDSLKFGVKTYLGSLMQTISYRVDMFLVAVLIVPASLATAQVGYYSVSVSLAEALWYFPGAVGVVILSRTPGISAAEANKSTPRICRNTLFITFLLAIVLFALGKAVIVLFFGPAFLPALRPLYILLPGIVALSIFKVLADEMAGRGKPMVLTISTGIAMLVNIPLNLLLIPRMGIEGAALASTVSYSACAFIVLVMFLRISRARFSDTVIIKKEDLQLYAAVLLSGLKLVMKGGRRSYHVLTGLSERKS